MASKIVAIPVDTYGSRKQTPEKGDSIKVVANIGTRNLRVASDYVANRRMGATGRVGGPVPLCEGWFWVTYFNGFAIAPHHFEEMECMIAARDLHVPDSDGEEE